MNRQERIDQALDLIYKYGGIDGGHHKQWVLDQVVRALTGCPEESPDALGTYWSNVRDGSAKDRWISRLTSTDWYTHDWSGGGKILIDGPMGPGCKMYVTGHAFAEGISRCVSADALKPYEPGRSQFTLDLRDANAALAMMQRINAVKEIGS
jgi:hypothetical protein